MEFFSFGMSIVEDVKFWYSISSWLIFWRKICTFPLGIRCHWMCVIPESSLISNNSLVLWLPFWMWCPNVEEISVEVEERRNNFSSLWMLICVWAVNGFFQSMGYGACARVLANWFTPSSRGRVVGIFSLSFQLGNMTAWLLAAQLADTLLTLEYLKERVSVGRYPP